MLPCDGPAICKPERTALALICLTNAGWVGLDLAIVAGLVLRH